MTSGGALTQLVEYITLEVRARIRSIVDEEEDIPVCTTE